MAHNKPGNAREEVKVVLTAKKSFIKFDGKVCVSKDTPDCMDHCIGAKIADLTGIYILNELADQFPDIKSGLYREDSVVSPKHFPPEFVEGQK